MIKQLSTAFVALFLCAGFAQAADDCAKQATDKKLAGAAKISFMKKCGADAMAASPASAASAASPASPAAAACDKAAADKKLAGAAKSSFTKKCLAEAK